MAPVSIMRVPALFSWLSAKYPKIITSVVEEQKEDNEKAI
jgi:5'-3' exonuclease